MLKSHSILLSAPLFLFLSSCASSNQPFTISETDKGTIVEIRETILIPAGTEFDGKNALYEWIGEGDCSQTEGMPPMFKLASNSSLKNLRMRNAPDGIHIRGSNVTIDNIINVDVCEDAISVKLDETKNIPSNIIISNSKFYDCDDKAIQITRGDNIWIKNNEFHRCAKAMRSKEKATNIRFENNKIYDAKVAIKATGGNILISGNFIDGAKVGYWAEKKAVITNGGGNRLNAVTKAYRKTEGGEMVLNK